MTTSRLSSSGGGILENVRKNVHRPIQGVTLDSITHALAAVLVFSGPLQGMNLLAAVLGAVLPDCDVLFHTVSSRDPRLFLFTHGGFTHSFLGTSVTAAGITTGFVGWSCVTGQNPFFFGTTETIFFAALGGALTHVILDFLALPGIPLLYPITERKFCLKVFPGPSILLLLISLIFISFFLLGLTNNQMLHVYAAFFVGVIVARAGLRAIAVNRFGKGALPTFDPTKWLVIDDAGDRFRVFYARLFSNPQEERIYPKSSRYPRENPAEYRQDPEIRRLIYNSYIVITERQAGGLLLRDPLREDGYFFYPPEHTRS